MGDGYFVVTFCRKDIKNNENQTSVPQNLSFSYHKELGA